MRCAIRLGIAFWPLPLPGRTVFGLPEAAEFIALSHADCGVFYAGFALIVR